MQQLIIQRNVNRYADYAVNIENIDSQTSLIWTGKLSELMTL
jgi:hypothetical protein